MCASLALNDAELTSSALLYRLNAETGGGSREIIRSSRGNTSGILLTVATRPETFGGARVSRFPRDYSSKIAARMTAYGRTYTSARRYLRPEGAVAED